MIINYISEADTLKKTILFDRDGTINVDFGYTASPTKPILTSMFQQLISNNFPWQRFNLGIVSNQSGIARTKYSYDDMFTFNSELIALLAAHGVDVCVILVCPHHPEDNCKCRKPSPKMLTVASNLLHADHTNIAFVGNAESDKLAAERAGISYFDIGTNDISQDLLEWLS
jgi:UDP-N-acetylmuramoyl-tripeptide--D-alanyl-D-alanine ligase